MIDALGVIKVLDNEFPLGGVDIRIVSDVHLGEDIGYINQYIFGLARQDRGQVGFGEYRTWAEKALRGHAAAIDFKAWPFEDGELAEAKGVLGELTKHYGVDLDIKRMARDLESTRPKGETYYLVVTINRIPVLG